MAALTLDTDRRFIRLASLFPLALVCLVLCFVGARADISFVSPNDMQRGALLLKGKEPGKGCV